MNTAPESAGVWIVAESTGGSVSALRDALVDAGFTVTTMAPHEVVRRLVRGAGGELIESLKDLLRGLRDADEEPEPGQRHRPDVIVVTAPNVFGSANAFARLTGEEVLRVGLVPDYALGHAWLDAPLHAWVVPVEGFVPPLVEAGVDRDRIEVAGPPVPVDYASGADGAALRAQWELSDAPVVFVHCDRGGWDLDRVVFQFSLLETPVQPIFYSGTDAVVSDALRRAASKHGVVADLLGSVPSLRDFHAVADLVVTGVDDPRIVDVLALDRPLLLVGEPEVRTQMDFLARQGAARNVPDVLRLGTELDLAARPDVLEAMRAASATVGKADGTATAAAAIAGLIGRRAEILASGRKSPDTRHGPFERIGSPRQHIRVAGSPAQHSVSAVSSAEAKDELARLIMMEREAQRKAVESERAVEQWQQRLELASQWNEAELASEAQTQLARAQAAAESGREELERTRLQKEKLKESVRRGRGDAVAAPAPTAGKFEDMEVERDLDALRKRLRDEMS